MVSGEIVDARGIDPSQLTAHGSLHQRPKPGSFRPQAWFAVIPAVLRESSNLICDFSLTKSWIPAQRASCAGRDDGILPSLDLDGRTSGFEFFLELGGVVLVHGFLHGRRSGLA